MDLRGLGVTAVQRKKFAEKGIFSVEDLTRYLPNKYYDFTQETGILPSYEISCITVTVNKIQLYNKEESKKDLVIAFCSYGSERVNIHWFHQPYLVQKYDYAVGHQVYVAGRLTYSPDYNNYSITSPLFFEPHVEQGHRIYPAYPKIHGMADDYLLRTMQTAINLPDMQREIVPPKLADEYALLPYSAMLQYLHDPLTVDQIAAGRRRMLFNDLLYFALRQQILNKEIPSRTSIAFTDTSIIDKIKESLPFKLTEDQLSAVTGLADELGSFSVARALIQGDVGCGKTIIAIMLLGLAAANGYQSVLMAPTRVLARQHFEDVYELLSPFGINVWYLGGKDQKASERKKVLAGIKDGSIQVIVGTQSVLSEKVEYKNLGLCIVDEEHRFGVTQRESLAKRSKEGVHLITMSATPIPRSLALTLYGESVSIYTIKTMPSGRKKTVTGLATSRAKIYKFIEKAARAGHQSYVVCPMIDQNETMEGVKSVSEVYNEYRLALPESVRIERLTGRTAKDKTEEILTDFSEGKIDVLISTSIVEVGINNPNATLMVVSNAERFGLAQLHQLRGRVGRSNKGLQSYCVLESSDESYEALERLNAMVEMSSGFDIAAADLQIRGGGDFLGTKQSGSNKYLALVLCYPEDYDAAKRLADEIVTNGYRCMIYDQALKDYEMELDDED